MPSQSIYSINQAEWDKINQSLSEVFGTDYTPSTPPELIPDKIFSVGRSLFEGKNHTEESKKKISENANPWHKGKKVQWSPEHIEKNRQNLIQLNKSRAGRIVSDETKEKLRQKAIIQNAINPPMKGRKHSEETKAKIRAKRALQTNVKNQYSKSSP